MSGPEAPLMSGLGADQMGQPEDGGQDDHVREEEEVVVLKPSEGPVRLFVWLLVASAGLSGLLFGYDTGVISSTLVSIGTSLSGRALTSLDKSVITSCTALFALLVSPFSSALADALGRRRVVLLADALFAAGAILQACSDTIGEMVAGRSVVGAAVGAASFVVPLYIAETAPASHRGRLITINVLFITLGQVVAYVVGWAFSELYGDKASGWRWMVGLGAAPAVFQAFLLLGMPETPRWLVKAGRSAEALVVIRKMAGDRTGSGGMADRVLKEIETEVHEEAAARRRPRVRREQDAQPFLPRLLEFDTWRDLFSVRRNRRALAIACLLQGLQQLCGFNSLMYFSATIFTMVGFATPTLTSLTVAITNFVFTVMALLLVDRIGRRRVLLYSLPFMIFGLLLAAFGFSRLTVPPSSAWTGGGGDGGGGGLSQRGAAVVILISIMVYVGSYAIGLGNVPWMQSELFSLAVRSVGSGVATGTNWLANFVVGLSFLPLMDALGSPVTFMLYAAICAAGYYLIWMIYPETTGLSLEESASLLEGDGWGLR